ITATVTIQTAGKNAFREAGFDTTILLGRPDSMTHRYHTLPWPSGLAQRDRALAQSDGMLCWRAPARDDRMKPNPARKYSAWPGLDKKLTCTPRPRPCKFTIPGDSCASVVFKRFRRASRPESFFAGKGNSIALH